ncbi:hypothetical protein [Myxosarcina sp. GI1(2024)]
MKIISLVAKTLRNIGHNLLVKKTEFQVEQKRDRYGNSFWRVYDYTTKKSHTFGSDRDVRAWIEKHHHSL